MAAPNPKPKYIKWVGISEAKKIIIADLEEGILDVDAPSAKNAYGTNAIASCQNLQAYLLNSFRNASQTIEINTSDD
jgi:hypothetical protein